MKKMLLISCVMLALTATAALAGGLNISWGPVCASDGLIINKVFACASNVGIHTMVTSFAPSADHALLLAVDICIDGQVAAGNPVIPNWWQFKNVGACRITALSTNAAYPGASVACQDPWGGQGTPTIDYYGDPVLVAIPVPPVVGPRARIKVGCSAPEATASGVAGGVEYFMVNVNVSSVKTVGTGLCTGCLVPMSWVFNSMQAGYGDYPVDPLVLVTSKEDIYIPISNQCITWQGGILCGETPTQNRTWGQVKSLYR